jgi:membrane protein
MAKLLKFNARVRSAASIDVRSGLGAVITLLLWFYLRAYVTLIGAELNAEIELQAIWKSSTFDPPQAQALRRA